MRKNKGYQLDIHKSWRGKEVKLSYAGGENKTPDQILEEVNKEFDKRIEDCKKEYEKISKKTTLVGEDLRKYCRDWMFHKVQFDDDMNLIPFEEALISLEEKRKRCLDSKLYGKYSAYQKRIINKDNQKFVYNTGSYGSRSCVRIPSLKRSNATWKRFYELFPWCKEVSHDPEKRRKYGLKKL